jgi:hypothetical protein
MKDKLQTHSKKLKSENKKFNSSLKHIKLLQKFNKILTFVATFFWKQQN